VPPQGVDIKMVVLLGSILEGKRIKTNEMFMFISMVEGMIWMNRYGEYCTSK
jgi:hypothetical protein